MITVDKLHKRYGDVIAVNDVSFSVSPGEIVGFLGPNGAGKSTTMRMISGFITPTSGTVEVMGHNVQTAPTAAKRCIGYLPEGAPAYAEMTTKRFLHFVAEARGMSPANARSATDAVTEQLNLQSIFTRPIENLSKGFKRRVGLAAALIDDPKVLILDEPTDGLDPNQKHEVRQLISGVATDKIVIISTHILEEVEAVCSRALFISKGRVVADDTPTALVKRSKFHNALRIETDHVDQSLVKALQSLPSVQQVIPEGGALVLLPSDSATIQTEVQKFAAGRGLAWTNIHTMSGKLEDVFRSLTESEEAA
ncbi:MAG: ATP-binding cassette domain-containing protein [Gammaproteobacteria bacterium]|nr:ATP-binding cassette domain-containing protein [Gammaproteobacteria bacterium]